MPFVLRVKGQEANPLAADLWGRHLDDGGAGQLVYYKFENGRTYFLTIHARGGRFGLDGLDFFRFKGVAVPEFEPGHTGDETRRNWRFHPGTITSQIEVGTASAIDADNNRIVAGNHLLAENALIRFAAVDGRLPAPLSPKEKYRVVSVEPNRFQVADAATNEIVDFADAGQGTITFWNANAGFDDPVQGRPQFFPELNLTFSGLAYTEGAIPANLSADEEPRDFAFGLRGRRLADFDAMGNQIAVNFSANNARLIADVVLHELKRPKTRINWASWFAFKKACDALVWERGVPSVAALGTGVTGAYYNGTEFNQLIATRLDPQIDFTTQTFPILGGNSNSYSIRWRGQIKARYTENYTFTFAHDDGGRVWINDQLIIDQWGTANAGTHTGTIALTKNQLVSIKVELQNGALTTPDGLSPAQAILKWSSASQPQEVVPPTRLYPLDSQETRFTAHLGYSSAVSPYTVIADAMRRAPGWDLQDVGGELVFVPPDRLLAHTFVYDPTAPAERWNIAKGGFEVAPRTIEQRPNFRVYFFRDINDPLFPEKPLEADRVELRERQGGMPTESAPVRLGVMSRSHARRIAEFEMKLAADPDKTYSVRGMRDSYHVTRGDRVSLAHVLTADSAADAIECLVLSESTATGAADEKTFNLLPVSFPLATDEPVFN